MVPGTRYLALETTVACYFLLKYAMFIFPLYLVMDTKHISRASKQVGHRSYVVGLE